MNLYEAAGCWWLPLRVPREPSIDRCLPLDFTGHGEYINNTLPILVAVGHGEYSSITLPVSFAAGVL